MIFPEAPPSAEEIARLRRLVELHRDISGFDREAFFMLVLGEFYDPMPDGLDRTIGNILYRLSDSIPKKVREAMLVYPDSDGSLLHERDRWTSLEQWRREWEEINADSGGIPFFNSQLSPRLEE